MVGIRYLSLRPLFRLEGIVVVVAVVVPEASFDIFGIVGARIPSVGRQRKHDNERS